MKATIRKPRRRRAVTRPAVLDRRSRAWEELLAVAGRLMAGRGPAAVSVEEILLGAGMSRGTFYSYCRNKTDLVVAIIEPVFVEGTRHLRELSTGETGGVVPGIIAMYLGLWRERRHALMLIPHVDAAAFARLRSAHEGFATAMQQALQRAADGGHLRNGSAAYSFRVIARTAVPLLRVYDDHPDRDRLYAESLAALLGGPGVPRLQRRGVPPAATGLAPGRGQTPGPGSG
jgi:AcrR family transcriptional regulator